MNTLKKLTLSLSFFSFFLIGFALLSPNRANAENVFLDKMRAKGVSKSQGEAVTELTRTAIEDLRGYKLVDSKSDAEVVLKPRVIQLGESIIFSITTYEDGEKVNSTKLKAVDFDDLDRVITRVVRGSLKGQNAKKNVRVDDVTREEMESTNRRIKPVTQWRFGIGPVSFNNLNDDEVAVGFFLGRHFAVNPDFAVNLNLDLAYGGSESNASIATAMVGVDYFISRASTSFYVTGNAGYSSTAANDKGSDDSVINIFGESKSGFAASAGVGVKLFRVSTVNLALQADYNYLFSENSLGNPNWVTFKILLFKGEN